VTDTADPGASVIELLRRDHDEIRRLLWVWPGVRLALSEQELADLGARLKQGKRFAPTRPHPSMPPHPQVQKLAERIAGATDRIGDALTGRTGI
jgi:hypothetical protein